MWPTWRTRRKRRPTGLKRLNALCPFNIYLNHVLCNVQLKRTTVEYCEATTLHGFAYLISAPRIIEKFVWSCVIACLHEAIVDWTQHPTATVYDVGSKSLMLCLYVL